MITARQKATNGSPVNANPTNPLAAGASAQDSEPGADGLRVSIEIDGAPEVESQPPLLTIVIPVYNEEKILETAVDELVRKLELWGKSYEIILSENGSRDGTVAIGKRLQERYDAVRL